MAKWLHGERVEVRTDQAELEHRQTEHHDKQRKGQWMGPKTIIINQMKLMDDEAEQRTMRQLAHAVAPNQFRVQEGRQRHEQCDRGKGCGNHAPRS